MIERAPKQSVAQFARAVRRAVLTVDPQAAMAAVKRAIAERNVRKEMRVHGMAAVVATLPAADAEVVYRALDACARKSLAAFGSDARPPVGALRADALTAWAEHALAEPGLPLQHGRRVEVQVVMDVATALGLAENLAELVGYGPIPAPLARELAADAKAGWRRLVAEPIAGHLLD